MRPPRKAFPKMSSAKKQRGVSLIEMMIVSGLAATGAIINFSSDQLDLEQQRARETGNLLFQYNNAVKQWIGDNRGAPNATYQGSAWLKPTSCGGLSAIEYLPCSFPLATTASPISFGRLSLTSDVVTTGTAPTQVTTVTTNSSPFTVNGARADLSGLSAITASAESKYGSYSSDPGTASITMVNSTTTTATTESWLRIDGTNMMDGVITFNDANAANAREIHNVSRIQNVAAQALYIGNLGGAAAGESVIVDANQDIYGKLVVANNQNAANGLEVTQGDIEAVSGSVIASDTVEAGNGVYSGGVVSADTNMTAPRYLDKDNPSFYLDPGATSNLNRVDAASVYTPIMYDADDNSYMVNPNGTSQLNNVVLTGDITASDLNADDLYANRFYDKNDSSYYVTPSAMSILSSLNVKTQLTVDGPAILNGGLQLSGISTEGSACSTIGAFSRTSSGAVLTCQNSQWLRPTNFYSQTVTSGGSCNGVGKGTFAFDSSNELYVCK